MLHRVSLSFNGSFCIILALMLLLLPLPWVLAVIFAVLVHEAFHAVAICILDGRIYGLQFGPDGIKMETDALTPGKELVAALAGPLGSALLILLARWLPRTAICGAVHCIYNLLPMFPMDGGRILRSGIALCLPDQQGSRLFEITQKAIRLILCAGCFLIGLRWGMLPALTGFVLLWRQRGVRTV